MDWSCFARPPDWRGTADSSARRDCWGRQWYHCDTGLLRESLAMANVLVRNLDDNVLKQLKAAAKAHGRSLQAEIHEVLRNASARRLAETRRLSAQWLKRLRGSTQSDSAALIREDRDTR